MRAMRTSESGDLYFAASSNFERSAVTIRVSCAVRAKTIALPSGAHSTPSSLSGVAVKRRLLPFARFSTPKSLAPCTCV